MTTTKNVRKNQAATKPKTESTAKKTSSKKTISADASSVVTKVTEEQLVVESLATLSTLVKTISETLDVLVEKTENLAYHLIATEEVLSEVVSSTGVDLATVNARIRMKIAQGTEKKGDPTKAIDVAASIVAPPTKILK